MFALSQLNDATVELKWYLRMKCVNRDTIPSFGCSGTIIMHVLLKRHIMWVCTVQCTQVTLWVSSILFIYSYCYLQIQQYQLTYNFCTEKEINIMWVFFPSLWLFCCCCFHFIVISLAIFAPRQFVLLLMKRNIDRIGEVSLAKITEWNTIYITLIRIS